MGRGNCCSIVCVGHIYVMMESALYTSYTCLYHNVPPLHLTVYTALLCHAFGRMASPPPAPPYIVNTVPNKDFIILSI